MHSIRVLRFIGSCPGGTADLKTLETKFGSVPQAHLDYLVQRGLIDYQLDFVGDELDIVGYELTVQGRDVLAEHLFRQKLNQRRKQQLAYQQAERECREALDLTRDSKQAREGRQHDYLVAVFSAFAQTIVEKLPAILALLRKLFGL